MSDNGKKHDPEKEQKKIKAVSRMKEIMTNYYIEAKGAREQGRKVAWITSGGPVEPLIAMDVIPVYPENHGAMIGASKMGGQLCEKAEEMGYSRDLCSYARADIADAVYKQGPIGGLPEPDMLVCCNNICGTVLKWYETAARYFDVPLFILDTPFVHREFSQEAQKYVLSQIHEYVGFLEGCCGRKMDYDRMEEVGRLSIEGTRLWQEVLDTCAHKPAPMTAFDAFFHLALIVTLRGTRETVEYYSQLLDELNERRRQKIAMVPNEKYRLLWDNLPVWYKTRWLSDKFASHDAALVADTYTSAWSGMVPDMQGRSFLEAMAETYTKIYINISIDMMFDIVAGMIKKYDVNGVVMHSNRSCKPYSLGQYDLRRMIMDRLGVPALIIEADMVDERSFSESQIDTRIDAFMEALKA
ncbi:MAG: 2-hydroxyacyl-CoA dehydratase subunit D [Desulfobacterales bacterium]